MRSLSPALALCLFVGSARADATPKPEPGAKKPDGITFLIWAEAFGGSGVLESTTFGESLPYELLADSYLVGLKGRSILTFQKAWSGAGFGVGFETRGGTRVAISHRTASYKTGLWRDQDIHYPTLRRGANGSVVRDYESIGPGLWADVYARFDGLYDRWRLEVSGVPRQRGFSATPGLAVAMERERFTIRSPFYAQRQFSEWTTSLEPARDLRVDLKRSRLDGTLRVDWRPVTFFGLYTVAIVGVGRNEMERLWANRNLAVTTVQPGYSVGYRAGILLRFENAELTVEYGGERHEVRTKKRDAILGQAYGSRGEFMDDRNGRLWSAQLTLRL